MSTKTRRDCVLSALFLCASLTCSWGQSQEKNALQQVLAAALLKAVAAESEKAVSEFSVSVPNTFQLHDAAKSVCRDFNGQDAVQFYKEVAELSGSRRSLGDAAELTAFLALAVLAEKHDTAPFLRSMVGDKLGRRAENALAAISFLPTSLARDTAEDVAADISQTIETRIKLLFLLRAVGDRRTLDRLQELATDASPQVRQVQSRTAEFIKLGLDRKTPAERERWARQELIFMQAACHTPGFRSGRMGLAWAAEQIHQTEPDIAVELLETRLKLERPMSYRYDYNVLHEIAITAAIVGLQKNRELLPLLDEWAATDFGFVSSTCRETATQLRATKN